MRLSTDKPAYSYRNAERPGYWKESISAYQIPPDVREAIGMVVLSQSVDVKKRYDADSPGRRMQAGYIILERIALRSDQKE